MENTYSISDLEKLTGLSRRTIHYYTMQKLIPPPESAGVSAKYHEEHLLRLILINQMQKSHIRLSGIREALEAMSVNDMRRLVDEIDKSRASWDFTSIQNWLSGNISIKEDMQEPEEPQSKEHIMKDYSFISESHYAAPPDKTQVNYLSQLKRKPVVNDTSWRRLEIIDGLEVNVRSDVEQQHGQKIMLLVEQIKKII